MKKSTLTILALGMLTTTNLARFARPVDRIVKNLSADLKKSPQNAQIHYTLARVLYLASANGVHNHMEPGSNLPT